MTQRDAFLEAICAAPDDDTPRLVYADWLEEQGDGVRAEFIRVQIALAQTIWPCNCGANGQTECRCPKTISQYNRAHDLWLQGRAQWGSELPSVLGDATNEYGWWHRGFVERVTLPVNQWHEHAALLRRLQPIRELTLTRSGKGDDRLNAFDGFDVQWFMPQYLKGLRRLCFGFWVSSYSLESWHLALPGTEVTASSNQSEERLYVISHAVLD